MPITPPVMLGEPLDGPLPAEPGAPGADAPLQDQPPPARPDAEPADPNWRGEAGKFGLVVFGCCWLLLALWLISSNSPSATGPYVDGPARLLTPTVGSASTDDDRLSPSWVVSRGGRLPTPVPTVDPDDLRTSDR